MNRLLAALAAASFLILPFHARADDASRLAAAEELVSITHMQHEHAKTVDQIIDAAAKKHPDLGPNVKETVKQAIEKFANWNDIKLGYAKVYAGLYTEEELKELVIFYKSPLGQKLISNTAATMTRCAEVIDKRLDEHHEEFFKVLEDGLKTKKEENPQ